MKLSYMVVYQRVEEENWVAWVPDIGGAVGAGDSLEQARGSVREGIAVMLEDLAERGSPAPPAVSKGVDFSEFDPNPVGNHYEVEWITVDLSRNLTDLSTSAQAA